MVCWDSDKLFVIYGVGPGMEPVYGGTVYLIDDSCAVVVVGVGALVCSVNGC